MTVPELINPGWYKLGEYQVPCGIYLEPADAAKLGQMGPATRKPQVNERGKQTQVITEVRKRGQGGQLMEPNLVRRSEDGQYCVAFLDQPGTYQVSISTKILQWIWVVSEEASSVSVKRLNSQELPTKLDKKDFIIYVRGDCKDGQEAPHDAIETKGNDPVPNHLREALLQALSERGQEVDDSNISIEPVTPETLWRFVIRIDADGCVLPSFDSFANCRSTNNASATNLLVGSLQIAGMARRINARVVDVETGIIKTAAKGDAQGSNLDSLVQAASDAIDALTFPLNCQR